MASTTSGVRNPQSRCLASRKTARSQPFIEANARELGRSTKRLGTNTAELTNSQPKSAAWPPLVISGTVHITPVVAHRGRSN